MNRTLALILSFVLLVFALAGCNGASDELLITDDGVPPPYVTLKQGDWLTFYTLNWISLLGRIPSDHYVAYPGQHGCPVSATLYKNGRVIELDTHDPRLVQLLNFYNNAIYHHNYDYTQGSYDPEDMAELEAQPFRLELTYVPVMGDGSFETTFDKFIITNNTFVGIRTTIPFGSYPFSAFGRDPLHYSTYWLTLFGF